MTQYQAVLCPPGNGWDTHRLWEVVALGALAIIRHEDAGPLASWLARFRPRVVLVDDYRDVTRAALAEWVARAEAHGENHLPIEATLAYWHARLMS